MSEIPRVFISYSHDSETHKEWVLELASWLRKNGVDIILDQWDLKLGSDLPTFMENGLSTSDRVLLICTDKYIEKAEKGSGGVGYEKMILTAEIIKNIDTKKIIPVVRNVTKEDKLPRFLGARLYINLSDDIDSEEERKKLLKELHNISDNKPPLGENPFKPKKKEKYNKIDSTVFFYKRFASAFPGIRGLKWFSNHEEIKVRLNKLLEQPLVIDGYTPIWWWRDGNLHIDSFRYNQEEKIYLMGPEELKISKIAAFNPNDYCRCFVYVETKPMPQTGLYQYSEEDIKDYVKEKGYYWEEYGLYKGKHLVSRAEYDDGAAFIDGELIEFDRDVELRVRYVTPYNFVIAAHHSPINNSEFDEELAFILNNILFNKFSLDILCNKILKLPKYRGI